MILIVERAVPTMDDPTVRKTAIQFSLMTTKEAAAALRITPEQVRGLVHDGDLEYVNVGRGSKRPRMMFEEEGIAAFIARRKRRNEPWDSRARSTVTARASARTSMPGANVTSLRLESPMSAMRKKLLSNIDKRNND